MFRIHCGSRQIAIVGFFFGTIGPNSGLVVPFDHLFAEKVSAEDVIGVRFHIWLKSDEGLMETASRWCVSARKPNQLLQTMCEAMALEAP